MASERDHLSRGYDSESERGLGLLEMMAMIWRRKWYLVGFVLFSMALGGAYLWQLEPAYEVEARVLVQQRSSPMDQGKQLVVANQDFLATQAEIIRSPAVIESAVKEWRLSSPPGSLLEPAEYILKNLSVEPIMGTAVLAIRMQSPGAEEAVRTVEALIAAYREYSQHADRENHIGILRMLTGDEKRLREELDGLTAKYVELRKQSPLIGQGRDAATVQNLFLTKLGQELTEAKSRRLALEGQLKLLADSGGKLAVEDLRAVRLAVAETVVGKSGEAEVSSTGGTGQATPPASTVSPELENLAEGSFTEVARTRDELNKAKALETELRENYGPKHPTVLAAAAQRAAWESRLEAIVREAPVILQGEAQTAKLHEDRLVDLYEDEVRKVKAADGYALQEQQALEEIERVRTVYGTIVAQLQQWQWADQALAEGRSRVQVSVLEAPVASRQVPLAPVLLLAVCGVVGLVGGFGAISILERTDTRIHSLEEAQNRLSLPVLGRIPVLGTTSRRTPPFLQARMVSQMPDSAGAEAFRALRTRLGTVATADCGVVLELASPCSGEGKTTVTANLACSFAQLGKRVVVVDADLRKGVMHRVFDVSAEKGLASVLRGEVSLEQAIERSSLGHVDVLSRGPAVAHPAELLSQPELEGVLKALVHEYDIVLLDTPPLLQAAEASAIATKTDGVIVNLMVGRSSIRDVQAACELLDSLGAKILGVVGNQVQGGKRYGYGTYTRQDPAAGKDAPSAACA